MLSFFPSPYPTPLLVPSIWAIYSLIPHFPPFREKEVTGNDGFTVSQDLIMEDREETWGLMNTTISLPF